MHQRALLFLSASLIAGTDRAKWVIVLGRQYLEAPNFRFIATIRSQFYNLGCLIVL